MRNVFRSLAIAAGLVCAAGAHADTTFSLALTPTGPGNGGTGSVSLSSAPSSMSVTTYDEMGLSGNTVDSLSFSIDGFSFDLTSAQGDSVVEFTDGTLSGITFDGALIGATDIQVLGIDTLGYDFADLANSTLDESGTVSATPVVTPEPASVALLGTGVMASLGFLRRRQSSRA